MTNKHNYPLCPFCGLEPEYEPRDHAPTGYRCDNCVSFDLDEKVRDQVSPHANNEFLLEVLRENRFGKERHIRPLINEDWLTRI